LTLRPYGLVLDGRLEPGLEVELDGSKIVQVRPHTGPPEPFVLSPGFVNAHSHLEYRGLQGAIREREFWPWIRAITELKKLQTPEEVMRDANLAVEENAAAGVALIWEHSDRPVSGRAMAAAGLAGRIFQETITFFAKEAPDEKLREVERRAAENAECFEGPVSPSPHAVYTVDSRTLRSFGSDPSPISIHLAESPAESEWTRRGKGPIADFYREQGVPFEPSGESVVRTAAEFGLLRPGSQAVHVCDADEDDVECLARSGVSVAHCPRSNLALGCPDAPVRELLDAGVRVGLGMDSPASSGPIDMFAEMRAALSAGKRREKPLSAEEVWRLATDRGASSLGVDGWRIEAGRETPLIRIEIPAARSVEDMILRCDPSHVAPIR